MKKKKILIINSRYNFSLVKGLIQSASKQLSTQKSWIQAFIIDVPGAFEIPITIEKNIKQFDGFIALGCIIKGETNNFDLISKSITDALMQLSLKHKKPIGNGIITCFNNKQAYARKDKGREAAVAVQAVLSNNITKIG